MSMGYSRWLLLVGPEFPTESPQPRQCLLPPSEQLLGPSCDQEPEASPTHYQPFPERPDYEIVSEKSGRGFKSCLYRPLAFDSDVSCLFMWNNDNLGGLKEILYEKLPLAKTGTQRVPRAGTVLSLLRAGSCWHKVRVTSLSLCLPLSPSMPQGLPATQWRS